MTARCAAADIPPKPEPITMASHPEIDIATLPPETLIAKAEIVVYRMVYPPRR
ncbi:hypothetical protein MSEN_28680 [Mycolicibacter senuensis]|uniref:Uncharacterized protein n=1 Tax=Mycolicibacter senuensis TaxID=386913 RepID=A0A7I9XN39_9MYCO|nr:hypothetical protein MSEN_28680 [Mycolicibacter senuensis]